MGIFDCSICYFYYPTYSRILFGMDTAEAQVNTLLDKIRPYIQMHGGDVQFLRIEDGTAVLKVYGACVDCSLASVTYTNTIGPLLIKEVEEITNVTFE